MYAVISEPTFDGTTQVIVTLKLVWLERYCWLILYSDESATRPASVLAVTLKV
jgi:hypothetical protein